MKPAVCSEAGWQCGSGGGENEIIVCGAKLKKLVFKGIWTAARALYNCEERNKKEASFAIGGGAWRLLEIWPHINIWKAAIISQWKWRAAAKVRALHNPSSVYEGSAGRTGRLLCIKARKLQNKWNEVLLRREGNAVRVGDVMTDWRVACRRGLCRRARRRRAANVAPVGVYWETENEKRQCSKWQRWHFLVKM